MKYTNYILTIAFLAFSISCSTTANGNQTSVLSQNAADSGTASSLANNETSEAQTAAPEAVVRELYKLHNADKSPLYKAKNRVEMEKFFAKDFVNLIWVGGSEPNLMNKLAIEGDVLTGIDSLSQSEGENVGKAEINGSKATVPVTINAVDEEKKKYKNTLNYELVKESTGWRVADIKYDGFYSNSLIGTIKNMQAEGKKIDKEIDEEFRSDKPPFVGKRWFTTDKEGSGTGTPQFYLKINENNYAFCGFMQTNQADGEVTQEEVPLGLFKNKFDCNFTKIDEKHSYQVKGNFIYELDKNKKIIEDSQSEFYEDNLIKGQN